MAFDLSVLIPARNEEHLNETVLDGLANSSDATEFIVILDEELPDVSLDRHPRVTVSYEKTSIGQRAATNQAARLSSATYVMKADAHVSFAPGFDVELIKTAQELGPLATQIPSQRNLHAFNWKCLGCGGQQYQGPRPDLGNHPPGCPTCNAKHTQGGPFEKVRVWKPRRGTTTSAWCFDHTMHFNYWSAAGGRQTQDIEPVMTSLGACFFMRRDRFFEIGGLDEAHGSWGQYGVEIACKSWLSGGTHVVNKRTWFAHLFRTQPGYGFPYPLHGSDQEKARKHSRDLWWHNGWSGQTLPLSWLVEQFAPVPGWHEAAKVDEKKEDREERLARLDAVMAAGKTFVSSTTTGDRSVERDGPAVQATVDSEAVGLVRQPEQTQHRTPILNGDDDGLGDRVGGGGAEGTVRGDRHRDQFGLGPVTHERSGHPRAPRANGAGSPRKGIIYYSDSRPDESLLAACRTQLVKAAAGLPIVSVTLKPTALGRNIVVDAERGYLTMARQILTALEWIDTDYVFFAEHDVLYSPEHFQFMPERDDVYYYDTAVWKVDAVDGKALHYDCEQLSGLCAHRRLLLDHFRRRVAALERDGFTRRMGFEPGKPIKHGGLDDVPRQQWQSVVPNVDIRHADNLTSSRWSQHEFRNKKYCQGWTEGTGVPGWGETAGRFPEFLAEVVG